MLYPVFGSPRAPKIEKSVCRNMSLSGVRFVFSAPPYHTKWGVQESFPSSFNIFNEDEYVRGHKDNAPFIQCFNSQWDIKGFPVVGRRIGWINFSVCVTYIKNASNLFKKLEFEKSLTKLHASTYGIDGKENRHTYETFINWEPQSINGNTWVNYLTRNENDGTTAFTLTWEIPISDQHALSVIFTYYNVCNNAKTDATVKAFSRGVMQTAHLKLSPAAQEQKAAAEKQWPNQKYSEHMEPLRWIRPKKDFISVEEYFADNDDDK
ncbi:hypothetical protein [Teredinibacter turnerae]|uniref:hypothetical protein n=1 Tax=Teredinibacter turnerae TaxID=2426 RepID=UPI000362AA0F|nr:hypothetical protein [Teredinibacter turnerae]